MKNRINKIIKKLKEKILAMSDKKRGLLILGILAIVFLVFTAFYVLGANNISSIEEKELKNQSEYIAYHLEDLLLDSKKVDKYIIFALDYSYDKDSKTSLTIDELYEFLSNKFTKKFNKEDIENIGVTPLMVDRSIIYEPDKKCYTINKINNNAQDIAKTPVKYFKLNKISKSSKKKYKITYTTYTIEDPYKMLNYYIDNNDKNVDITPIRNYLMGASKISSFKNSVIPEDVKHYGKKGKKVSVTFVVKDDNIRISNIRKSMI